MLNPKQPYMSENLYPKIPDEYSELRNVAGEIRGAGYIINYAINLGLKKLHERDILDNVKDLAKQNKKKIHFK